MKVKELIDKLNKLPPSGEIKINKDMLYLEIKDIEEIKDEKGGVLFYTFTN